MTSAPVPPSAVAFWLGQVDQEGAEQAIDDAAADLAKRFKVRYEQRKKALLLRKKPPGERLAEYQQRSAEQWTQLRTLFPKEYQEQTADQRLLERKVARGEMAPPLPPPPAPPSPFAPSLPPYGLQQSVESMIPPVKAESLRERLFPGAEEA